MATTPRSSTNPHGPRLTSRGRPTTSLATAALTRLALAKPTTTMRRSGPGPGGRQPADVGAGESRHRRTRRLGQAPDAEPRPSRSPP